MDNNTNAGPFHYVPRNRPAGFSTVPSGVKWDYVEAPKSPMFDTLRAKRPELPVSKHNWGVIGFERALTVVEAESYELDPVPTPFVPTAADAQRVRAIREDAFAVATFIQNNEDLLVEVLAQNESLARELRALVSDAFNTLDAIKDGAR